MSVNILDIILGGAGQGVKKVIGALPQESSNPEAMIRQATPTPTTTPTPTPTAVPTPTPFQFQMGESDYSRFQPQMEKYYTEQNSPALAYVPDMIKAANTHGVDPRVLGGIMFSESSNMKNYPPETFNPVGYLVNGGGVEGLQNAGFTSIPHMIDRVTSRFGSERNKYPNFTENPNVDTLQSSYNANPSEREQYLIKVKAYLDSLEKQGGL